MNTYDRALLTSFGFPARRRSHWERNVTGTLLSGLLLLGLFSLYQWFFQASALSAPDWPQPVMREVRLFRTLVPEPQVVLPEIDSDPLLTDALQAPPAVEPAPNRLAAQAPQAPRQETAPLEQQPPSPQPPPQQPPKEPEKEPPKEPPKPSPESEGARPAKTEPDKPQEKQEAEKKASPARRSEVLPDPFQLALYYQKSGDWRMAMKEYLGILERDPLNYQVRDNLGLVYQDLQRYGEAAEEHRKAILIKRDYVPAYNNLGVALLQDGKIEEAFTVLKEGLAIASRDAGLHTNLGLVYKKQGERELAVQSFMNSLQFNPNYPEAHYNLGLLYEEMGELEKAVSHYQNFLRTEGGHYLFLANEVRRHLKTLMESLK